MDSEKYCLAVDLGTSSYISCHITYKKTDPFRFVASTPAAIPGKYILGSEQECACVCLNQFQKIMNESDDTGKLSCGKLHELAEGVEPGCGGLLFLPWLLGERTPADDSLLRGGFVNMSLNTDRAKMVRSILEGVAFNSRWMMEYVERFMKKRINKIRMIGRNREHPSRHENI